MKLLDLSSKNHHPSALKTGDLPLNNLELREHVFRQDRPYALPYETQESSGRKQLRILLENLTELVSSLEQQIISIERKAGITDVKHPLHPSLAKEAARRRENLMLTIEILQTKLEESP